MANKKQDGVHIDFSAAKYAVLESKPTIMLPVERSGDMDCVVAVKYKTKDGTAIGKVEGKEGGDFEHLEDELVFQAQETVKHVEVRIIDDIAYEDDEDFYVVLFEA